MWKLFSAILFTTVAIFAFAQSEENSDSSLISAFSEGNAEVLSPFLNKNIEVTLSESTNVFSKSQAKIVLRNFFKNNRPINFETTHISNKRDSWQILGSLHTTGGSYNIAILAKNTSAKEKNLIHQIRIEKQN